jgi:hypothetical protein
MWGDVPTFGDFVWGDVQALQTSQKISKLLSFEDLGDFKLDLVGLRFTGINLR